MILYISALQSPLNYLLWFPVVNKILHFVIYFVEYIDDYFHVSV